ncbi:MAG: hypothetical protein IBJ10_01125 [Phycisphaerales bacterium]|nr:hypothetical protein [Phycisphaerales bacterium]
MPRQHPHSVARLRMAHAIKRARERFGVELTFNDLERMTQAIRAGRLQRLHADRQCTMHLVTFPDGARAVAVYDVRDRSIRTLLTVTQAKNDESNHLWIPRR